MAQLSLTCEYGWFQGLLWLQEVLVGGPFTSSIHRQPILAKSWTIIFRELVCWRDCQGSLGNRRMVIVPNYPHAVFFSLSQPRNSNGTDSRQIVAQFMCHDTSRADIFYEVDLNARQAVEHSRLFEEALEGVDRRPRAVFLRADRSPRAIFLSDTCKKTECLQAGKTEVRSRTSALQGRRAMVLLSPLKIPPTLRKRPLSKMKSPHRVSKSYRLSGLAYANLARKVVKASLEGITG